MRRRTLAAKCFHLHCEIVASVASGAFPPSSVTMNTCRAHARTGAPLRRPCDESVFTQAAFGALPGPNRAARAGLLALETCGLVWLRRGS